MTIKEIETITEAIEKCQENINRSFDKFIDDLKALRIDRTQDLKDIEEHQDKKDLLANE